MNEEKNYVYMTVLTNNVYVQGVILLNETLKKVKSKYPLIVLVTEEVAKPILDILDYLQIKWKTIITIEEPLIINKFKNNQILPLPLSPLWYNTLTKIQIFNQIDYDKIIYLDSDIMVLKNIDHLFNEKNITATKRPDNHLTTGLLIINPSQNIYNNFINFLNIFNPYKERLFSPLTGDEELLEIFLIKNNITISYINNKNYNTLLFSYFDYNKSKKIMNNSFCIHFQGPIKPWDSHENLFKNYKNIGKNYIIKAFPYVRAYYIIKEIFDKLPLNLINNFIFIYYKEMPI